MRTCVIIPTYNEANTIADLIKRIRQLSLEVVVVDDGSQDDTSLLAKGNGAIVLRNEKNEGKGSSLRKGFRFALENNFDALITMDGDGQHLPEDIPFFLRLAKYSQSTVFIGSRMFKHRDMPLVRRITNKFMSWLISVVAKQKIPDSQCGFRLIKKEILEKLKLESCKYEMESELLIKASRLGYKIESVPIKTIYNGEKSQINPLIDTLRFIKLMTRQLWTTQ